MIPPHLKRVAAPPCEMLSGFENEYLQGSVATHLRCVVILIYYKFTAKRAGERILKIGQYLTET